MTFLPAPLKLQEGLKFMMKDPVSHEGWFSIIEKAAGCKLMVYFDDNNKEQAIPIQKYIDKIKSKS